MRNVFVSVLKERSQPWQGVDFSEDMFMRLGSQPIENTTFHRISIAYMAVDTARNFIAQQFIMKSASDDDTLIMMDGDHEHPQDLPERLVARNKGVVGVLAFKRRAPYWPIVYVTDPKDGKVRVPKHYPQKLIRVARVGFAAIAIQRSVFFKLTKRGFNWPWFRYIYDDYLGVRRSEDMYFCECCEKAGIPMYCDLTLVSPHLDAVTRAYKDWEDWQADNKDYAWNGASIEPQLIDDVPEKYIISD